MVRVHSRIVGRRLVCGVAAVFVMVLAGVIAGSQPPAQTDDYGYDPNYLNDQQREGRDTWYFWTGGSERFWVEMARVTDGNVNLLNYLDSRRHGRRFRELGAITQPGCEAATGPDQYGLWLDRCDQPPVPGVPGDASGIVGLRKFPNPRFDARQVGRGQVSAAPRRHAAAVPGRHDLRLLPHRLQPAQSARRSRAAGLGEPGRHDRQPVLGGREAVQPQHEAR